MVADEANTCVAALRAHFWTPNLGRYGWQGALGMEPIVRRWPRQGRAASMSLGRLARTSSHSPSDRPHPHRGSDHRRNTDRNSHRMPFRTRETSSIDVIGM